MAFLAWKVLWTGLVILQSGIPPVTYAQSSVADSAAVARAVGRFHDALAAGDSATVATMVAPNAVVLEGGGFETRAEYLSHHFHHDVKFVRAMEVATQK